MRRALGVVATLVAVLGTAQARDTRTSASAGSAPTCSATARSLAPREFTFPRDHAAHAEYPVEWWRSFGRVHDGRGRRYDLTINISRFALDLCASVHQHGAGGGWGAASILTETYAILDESSRRIERGMHVDRIAPLGAHLDTTALDIEAAGDVLAASGRRSIEIRIRAGHADPSGFDVRERPEGAAVPLGPGGVLQTGSCAACAAYAYAYPRVATRGTIRLRGVERVVAGATWFEHEFARRELGPNDTGWSRFEIQFDDGRDVDVRLTRGPDGRVATTSGAFVAADGSITYLRQGDASASIYPPGAVWSSAATDIRYPDAWLVGVAPAHLGLAVAPVEQDQELRSSGRQAYYSGAIEVEKSDPPGGDRGHGFVELTGYGSPTAL